VGGILVLYNTKIKDSIADSYYYFSLSLFLISKHFSIFIFYFSRFRILRLFVRDFNRDSLNTYR